MGIKIRLSKPYSKEKTIFQNNEKSYNSINYYIENIQFININKNDRIATSKNFYETILNNIKYIAYSAILITFSF